MKAKVAILKSQAFKIGGLEKYTAYLAKAFREEGLDVFLLTTGIKPIQSFSGIELVSIYQPFKWNFLATWWFNRGCQQWLKENPMDIIFGMEKHSNQTHLRLGNGVHRAFMQIRKKKEGLLKYLTLCINPLNCLLLRYEKKSFFSKGLKVIFTNSQIVKEQVFKYYPSIDRKKVKCIHNGVQWKALTNHFEESFKHRTNILTQLGLDPKKRQLLFVGNGFRRKGLDVLLQALATMKEKNYQLSVVGKDKKILDYKKRVKLLNLNEQVIFHGLQEDVLMFYQAADHLVLPTLYDPFANVTLEALALGVSVITSNMNGGCEVIQEHNGWVFYRDSELAKLLESALVLRKSRDRAEIIRNSVAHLDFSKQLSKLVKASLD